jgi:hypothetical protein
MFCGLGVKQRILVAVAMASSSVDVSGDIDALIATTTISI